jgi:hypothetical protein
LATALLGGGVSIGGPTPRPPDSIRALRKAFEAVGTYDGLEVRFGRRKPRHLYRDPSLLITGHAKLFFDVVK